jgi:PP-loop superfamily ATP-utilizing enzyme
MSGQAIPLSPASSKEALAEKRGRLEEILSGLGRTLVAYSGGVDSAYLLAESHRVAAGAPT